MFLKQKDGETREPLQPVTMSEEELTTVRVYSTSSSIGTAVVGRTAGRAPLLSSTC